MSFILRISPHTRVRQNTSDIMLSVVIAAIPGLLAQIYFFGWGTLIQLLIAVSSAIALEVVTALVRKRPMSSMIRDNSGLVAAWLLAVAIPPQAPWWVIVIGITFALITAKQIYGGLGQNPFNPAMIGYVVLLTSFPLQMTSWLPPRSLAANPISLSDSVSSIFTGFNSAGVDWMQMYLSVDGITIATPLDTVHTLTGTSHDIFSSPLLTALIPGERSCWLWVNISYLCGGLILLIRRIIRWHIPASVLLGITVSSEIGWLMAPNIISSPMTHLFSGATMLGAFFIATDPVTSSTTNLGRIVFGIFIGIMIFIIRTWSGFPDGVAFAVLLGNMCVPLIDYYTKPRTYGH